MGDGPFTLFAPNDDAFADAARALKISKIELMALPSLGDILKYHVIAGKVGMRFKFESNSITVTSHHPLSGHVH